jgi:4'-phosphopantetheinyl transferase
MEANTHAYWLEQTEADVSLSSHWLSAGETSRLASLQFEKRQRDWRLGRWTAKRAVASCLNIPNDVDLLAEIEIRAAPSGAPYVFFFDQPAAVSISLSHRVGHALCVVGSSRASLGCDLELVEPRDKSFLADYFTKNEQILLAQASADEQPELATLLWSAKESALKALHVGLRLETTCLDVSPTYTSHYRTNDAHQAADIAWLPLSLHRSGGHILCGCWRCANNMVRTVVFNSWPQGVQSDRELKLAAIERVN